MLSAARRLPSSTCLGLIFLSGLIAASPMLSAQPDPPMQTYAAVVSISGSPKLDGEALALRQKFDPNGLEISQMHNEDLGLVLGNQISLFASLGARWRVDALSGTVRPQDSKPWIRETTRSQTHLRLDNGALCFSANHLNDESIFSLTTPLGTLQISQATGIVKVVRRIVTISIASGQVSFKTEYSENPLLIGNGEQIVLSDISAIQLDRLERLPWVKDPAQTRQIQICKANAQRVYFTKNSRNPSLVKRKLADILWIKPASAPESL
ncbi:MAG: hypothetical protein AAF212_07110 [Verrucomicrobiota bacterium]